MYTKSTPGGTQGTAVRSLVRFEVDRPRSGAVDPYLMCTDGDSNTHDCGSRTFVDLRLSVAMRCLSLVGLVGPLVLTFACDSEGNDNDSRSAPRIVEVDAAQRGDAVEELRLIGQVRGETEVRVLPQVAERIRRLHVEEGDRVSAGDLIATLEGDLATSDVAQADAALNVASASRDQLQLDLQRVRGLVAESAAPASQLEQLEAQLRSAEAQVSQLRAAQTAAGQRRGRTLVRAPIDGVIAELTVNEGDLAMPQAPLCTVVQFDRVEVVARPIEADHVRLSRELPVVVSVPALPGEERTGVLRRISPTIDRVSRTGNVEVLVDNADHRLRPGMMAEVHVELSRRADVLMVPARSVLMTSETDTQRVANVFVRNGDRARRVEVEVGPRFRDRIEILSVRGGSLEGGDEVIVAGQHLLRDGSPVRVREAAPERPPPVTASASETG